MGPFIIPVGDYLTVDNSYQIHIQRFEIRLNGSAVTLCREYVTFPGDSRIGEDDIHTALPGIYFLKGRSLTFPRGDVAFFERNAGAGKLGLKLEDLGAGCLVDIEDSNVSVGLGDEVSGYTQANARGAS